MQTNFTLAQLADANTAVANDILRACVHCGFCLATCPTYVVLGDELDSPRGRIYLIKNMLESGAPATATEVKHLDRCLTCLSCMTTCPSSVHYMHLIDHARGHIERTYRRPLFDRLLRGLLNAVLPHAGRFRLALQASRLLHPFKSLMPKRLRALSTLAAAATNSKHPLRRWRRARERDLERNGKLGPIPSPIRLPKGEGKHTAGRVALLAGCVQPVLRPQINEAATRLLNRLGVEAITLPGSGCCGALSHHLSMDKPALRLAKANIDAWTREIDGKGLDAIVITASGCGTMIKDYGYMLRSDAAYREKAARISALTRDVSEVLAEIGIGATDGARRLAVAYHSACSLQHGQRVNDEPRALLRAAGFDVREVAEGHLCCGSAGIYNMLEPEISDELLRRKIDNVERAGGAVIATGNIGCITQLSRATKLPIVHTVELLDWATGGPPPMELSAAFAERA